MTTTERRLAELELLFDESLAVRDACELLGCKPEDVPDWRREPRRYLAFLLGLQEDELPEPAEAMALFHRRCDEYEQRGRR